MELLQSWNLLVLPLQELLRQAVIMLFVVAVSLKVLTWTYLWQLKEYRRDRMLDFLSTRSGKTATTNIWTASELLLLGLVALYGNEKIWGLLLTQIVAVFVIVEIFMLLRRRLHPVWTSKAFAIIVVALSFTGLGFLVFRRGLTENFTMVLLLLLVPLIVSLTVACFAPISFYAKSRLKNAAHVRLMSMHPTVIGITGSYGKTSTKEFLRHLLSHRFTVLATPKNVNADIGVAQVILQELAPQHEIFIAEMGAYRQGEIAATCAIAPPVIGILTAVNNQHLALFGSHKAIQQAKGELLRALPSAGLAVVNYDIPACREIAAMSHAQKLFFSTQEATHVFASDIVVQPRCVTFTLHCGGRKRSVQLPLFGAQVIPSFLAACAVAYYLGISMDDIVRWSASLPTIAGTMDVREDVQGCIIIDDHYNANPDGFLAALEYLAVWKNKQKVVCTPGMMELGADTDRAHRMVGQRIGEVADWLFITKKDFARPLYEGARHGGMPEDRIITSERVPHLVHTLRGFGRESVLLIEGRIQSKIVQSFFS